MADTDWLNDPKLKKMSVKKRKFLINLMKETDGKSAAETLPLLMNAQQQMRAQGIVFTDEERSVMLSLLTAKLTPMERARFDAMKKMMHF